MGNKSGFVVRKALHRQELSVLLQILDSGEVPASVQREIANLVDPDNDQTRPTTETMRFDYRRGHGGARRGNKTAQTPFDLDNLRAGTSSVDELQEIARLIRADKPPMLRFIPSRSKVAPDGHSKSEQAYELVVSYLVEREGDPTISRTTAISNVATDKGMSDTTIQRAVTFYLNSDDTWISDDD